MASFDLVWPVILKNEGSALVMDNNGYMVRYGLNLQFHPDLEGKLETMTPDEAKEIYRKRYWERYGLQHITDQTKAEIVMDTVLNHGRGTAIIQALLDPTRNDTLDKRMDQLYKAPRTSMYGWDNAMGPITRNAINQASNDFIPNLASARWEYVKAMNRHNPKALPDKWLPGLLKRYKTWNPQLTMDSVSHFMSKPSTPLLVLSMIALATFFLIKR